MERLQRFETLRDVIVDVMLLMQLILPDALDGNASGGQIVTQSNSQEYSQDSILYTLSHIRGQPQRCS